MKKSLWHREAPGEGRHYFLPKEVYYKYDEKEKIVSRLSEGINEFLHISPAIRITTDSNYSDSERLHLEIPYEFDKQRLLDNISDLIYRSLMGYYIGADPKTNHFGISNWLLEGNVNSFLNRELERILSKVRSREDMMGRVVKDDLYEISSGHKSGENYFVDILKEGMDITVGYSFHLFGNKTNSARCFIPLDCGLEVIDQVYYNLDNMLTQIFSVYDELNPADYLKISNTLIFKETVEIMKRSKKKEHTRKKLLNGLVFPSVLTEAEPQLYGKLIGDGFYDTLGHVDDPRIKESSDRSRILFNDFMLKTAEITANSVENFNRITLGAPSGSSVVPQGKSEVREKVAVGRSSQKRSREIKRDDGLQEL